MFLKDVHHLQSKIGLELFKIFFYKNGFCDEIEQRLGNMIEYFEEEIRQRNNYNDIYIYNESIKLQDINKPIELLVKSSNKFNDSLLIKHFISSSLKNCSKYPNGKNIS